MAVGDRISPSTVGDSMIVLSQSDKTPRARAFNEILVDVDYSKCDPAGVELPLLFRVVDPRGRPIVDRTFRAVVPLELSFRPQESGSHLVWLAEAFHHRWYGALQLEVEGEPGITVGDEAIGMSGLGPSTEGVPGGDF